MHPRSPEHPLLTLLLSICCSLSPLSSHAQTLLPEMTTFPPSTYNAHNQALCVQTLHDGRTAFGTVRDVFIHDGETFRHIPLEGGKVVFSMDRAPGDRLFVGGQNLMGVIEPDSSGFLNYRSLQHLLPDSLKDFGIIWNTLRTEKGAVYFNSHDHIFLYQNDTLKVIHPENQFYRLYHPDSRPITLDVDNGLFRLRGTEKEYLKGSRDLPPEREIHSILRTPKDSGKWTVFIGKHGLFHYDPGQGKIKSYPDDPEYVPEGGWAGAKIYTACRLNPKKNPYGAAFAVGTDHQGIFLLNEKGKIALQLGEEEGIPAEQVWSVAQEEGGDLWAATDNGIALVHTGVPFTVAPEELLFSRNVGDISRPTPDSPLFLATNQGIYRWEEKSEGFTLVEGTKARCTDFLPFPENIAPSAPNENKTKHEGPSSLLVTGTHAGILSIDLTSGKEGPPQKAEEILSVYCRSLTQLPFQANDGETPLVLAGGRDGLFVFSPGVLSEKGKTEPRLAIKKIPEGINTVGADRMGGGPDSLRLWASMRTKGVLEVTVDTSFSGYRTTHYDTTDGLPKGPIRVFPDSSGKGVVFGSDKGLYAFQNDRFVPYCHYGKIFCDGSRQIFRLKKGLNGELWINDWKGGRIKHLLPGKETFHIDSILFRGLDIGGIKAIHPEKEQVWLGGPEGLASYHPGVEDDHDRPWDCLIRKVSGSGDSLLFGGNLPAEDTSIEGVLELPYSMNRLEFHYAAPFTDEQEKVTYSHRLVGFDTAWSKWSDQTRKEYTNIPEGNYTFKVKAKNVYGVESSTSKYRFTVRPPWYRTWTAYGCYSLTGFGLIWLLIRLNSRRLAAQKQRLERIVEERTQEIREQKEQIEKQKEKVEEQQKETEKQKQEVEKQKDEVERAHQKLEETHKSLEESHREITASIDYAQKIQNALLRSEEYASDHLPEHFILFKPQATVSGDFYWAKEQGGYLYLAAIDCTGHGVPGAFMSMLGINQLNEIMAAKELPTPGEVLTDLRERVVSELRSSDPEGGAKDGMDAAMVKIPLVEDQNSKRVEFAGANNPLYVVKEAAAEAIPEVAFYRQGERIEADEGTVRPFKKSPDGFEIKGDKMAVGYEPDTAEAFTTAVLEVPPGGMLYMFSDGYADQFGGPKGKKFRYGPFKELLARIHTMSSEEQKWELDRIFEDWKEGQEQVDDVCVVGVRV